jgi:hypothetical protein
VHRADQLAKSRGGLGAYRDQATGEVVMVMPKALTSKVTTADIASVGASVKVRPSTLDGASIAAMEAEVEHLQVALVGDQAIVSGYDIRSDLFRITSDAPESLFADFEAKYPGRVAFAKGGFRFASNNRDNDSAPHWGGAQLDYREYNNPTGVLIKNCTAGYPVKVGTTTYMVTAGHCYSTTSWVVYGGTGLVWGSMKSRRDFPSTDVEMIGGSTYQGYIYTAYSAWAPIKGEGISAIDSSPWCVSGAANGTHCTYSELSEEQTVTLSGLTVRHLIALAGYGIKPGDSGAPVYAYSNNQVFILGSVSGNVTPCSPLPDSCVIYIEPWSRVRSLYGATLVTA